MQKIKLLFCFCLLGIIQLEAQDKVKPIPIGTITSLTRSIDNKPIFDIECDSAGNFSEYSGAESFNIDISIRKQMDYDLHDYAGHGSEVAILEGTFVNGKKESLWRKYVLRTKPLREETYKDGLLHGVSRVFSDDGKLLYQTIFINGTGYYKEYYNDNKQLFLEGEVQNGKREGEWLYYFKTGDYSRIENYKNGQLHGSYKIFSIDGKILYSTEFKNGTGWYRSFDICTNELLEEGLLQNNYRKGEWKYIEYYTNQHSEIREKIEKKIIETKDSPENMRMHHNLIEIVYLDGKVYYINASDVKR